MPFIFIKVNWDHVGTVISGKMRPENLRHIPDRGNGVTLPPGPHEGTDP